jgi:nucleolar MIF4G domain-containing protein 1
MFLLIRAIYYCTANQKVMVSLVCILPNLVLQVIHFAEVDQITVRFLRQVLLGVLLTDSEEAFQQAFQRVAVSSKLHIFQEGIRIFIHHFLLRNMCSLPQKGMEKLQLRAKMADKILSASESKVKF